MASTSGSFEPILTLDDDTLYAGLNQAEILNIYNQTWYLACVVEDTTAVDLVTLHLRSYDGTVNESNTDSSSLAALSNFVGSDSSLYYGGVKPSTEKYLSGLIVDITYYDTLALSGTDVDNLITFKK